MTHTIRTPHVQRLIAEGLRLAEEVDMRDAFDLVGEFTADQTLGRAANLLRHAAEELEDERMACFGWPQV